ncbi:MAG TPA: hypothetical protein VF461_01125 [Gemmatimonadaceae bacterium]
MNSKEFTERIVRWRTAGAAIALSTTIAVGAGAQQTETTGGATPRTIPCPTAQASPSAPTAAAGVSGATYGTPSATSTTGATTATTATPSDAATTAGVATTTTPNTTATNPDNRFKGLNATNGANGVGADTTTTGKKTAIVAGSLPADSAEARAVSATACAPATKDHS